jgi:prepilin-type N-terminal cleavage/methylation domain-containing protein
MKATRFPPLGGFTMIEVLAAMAILAAIGAVGVVAVANTKTNADSSKLSSDVASVNRSILIFQSSGGSLAGLSGADDGQGSHNDVLTKLKTQGSQSILGVKSSTLDARIYAVYQTSAEAGTSAPRAVWNAGDGRFQVVTTGGAGVKQFLLNEDLASGAPATDSTRVTAKTTSAGNGWVWDHVPPVEVASAAGATPQTGVADTGQAVMSNLGLDTGSWTVGASGQVTVGYGYREAGYQSRLALFSLDGMDIYDLTTDAGRKAFMLEAMRRILAGGTQGQIIIDASKNTPGSTTNTFSFNPGDQVAALVIPNTDLQSAMNALAAYNGTLAAYAAANPSTSPLVSAAKTGQDIPSFYSKQFAMLGTNSNTYAVEDMTTTTNTTADYQDMVFTATGMNANGTMNSIANPADFYTNAAMKSMDPGWTWDQTGVNGSTQTLHNYLKSVGVVP